MSPAHNLEAGQDDHPGPVMPHPVINAYYATRGERAAFVRTLFDRSARQYDRIDRVTSLGTGSWYRRKVLREAGLGAGMRLLDVGCGTGLVARPAAKIVGEAGQVLGVDPNGSMLDIARAHGVTEVREGTAESLPVGDGRFDMLTMGYALRHIDDLSIAFAEFARVLRPGGKVVIMEITVPRSAVGRAATKLVMRWLVPAVSAVLSMSTDGWRLMRYFWETIDHCVPPARVLEALRRAGFQNVSRRVELGVFSVYVGNCPEREATP